MKRTMAIITGSLMLTATALAGDINLGVKLYQDGLYRLAAKTFSENFNSLTPDEFKKIYKFMYLSFLKSNDLKDLEKLINYWEENLPDYNRGELLALELIDALKNGETIENAFPQEITTLPISEKIRFFQTLKNFNFTPQQLIYILSVAAKDLDLKGAAKESGFLSKALKIATEKNDYQLIDFIFDNFGRWFSSPEEELQYVKYLERKKQFADALIEAQKLYKKNPTPQSRLELARALYLNGKYNEALKLLKNPQTEPEKYLKAWCLFKLGKGKEIPSVLGISVSKPQMPEKLKTLLDFYSSTFDFQNLKKFYPDLYLKSLIFSFSTKIPDNQTGDLNDLGYIYYERGFYGKALKVLEKAIQNPSSKILTPRTLFILGKLGSLNTNVGTVVYNQLMNSYQNTPYYKESLIPAAKIYLYSGNDLLALKLLKYAENQLQNPPSTLKNLEGIALMNMGKFKEAAKAFLISRNKTGEDRTFEAFCLFHANNLKGTARVLKYLVKTNSVYPEVNEGRLIFTLKKLHRTGELRNLPFHTPLTKLMAAITSKNASKVEQLYAELPERERIAAETFLALYYENKNPQKALSFASDVYSRATDEETSTYAKKLLNYLAFTSNNYATVLLNDPKFIVYNPENGITSVDTLISKADDLIEAGEYGKAYGLLKLALERTTLPAVRRSIVKRMVEIDLKEKNYKKALKDLSLLPENTQKDKDLKNFYRFKIYSKENRLLDAFNAAKQIENVNNVPAKERDSFIAKLANYYKLAGDKDKALNLIEKLITENKLKNVDYNDLVRLAIFAENQNRLDLAEKLINEAVKKAKTKEQKVESLFWQASILAQKGDLEDALINYLKISYDYPNVEPWSSTATYRAAQILEQQGKLSQALKLYEKAAKMKKGTEEGEIAREKVKSLLQRLKGRNNGEEE